MADTSDESKGTQSSSAATLPESDSLFIDSSAPR